MIFMILAEGLCSYISVNNKDILKYLEVITCFVHALFTNFYTKNRFNRVFLVKMPCNSMYHGDFGIFLCVAHREVSPPPTLPLQQLWRHGAWMKRACKSPGHTPGHWKHELWEIIDEKTRAFVEMTKTLQIRLLVLPRAFLGQKLALARAFRVQYDQNCRLWVATGPNHLLD
jgi:hypothetical protein